jgi:IS30 family transposase
MTYPEEIQTKIRELKADNCTWKQIGKAVNKSQSAVRRWYQRNRNFFDLPPKVKVRKNRVNGRMALAVKKANTEDKRTSIWNIRGALKGQFEPETPINKMPSSSSIHNFITRSGFKKKRSKKISLLSARKIRRLGWNLRRNTPKRKKISWNCWFSLLKQGQRVVLIWRPSVPLELIKPILCLLEVELL